MKVSISIELSDERHLSNIALTAGRDHAQHHRKMSSPRSISIYEERVPLTIGPGIGQDPQVSLYNVNASDPTSPHALVSPVQDLLNGAQQHFTDELTLFSSHIMPPMSPAFI